MDMVGSIFGDYEVIECVGRINPKRRTKYYKLKCLICGEERIVPRNLQTGFDTKYYHSNRICVNYFRNLEINKTYGDYKVIEFIEFKNNCKMYKVQCQVCKRFKIINITHFHNGLGTSHQACVKLIKEPIDKRFYEIWAGIRKRTTNSKFKEYESYGGRGISSESYKYFIDFYDDMYKSYVEHCKLYGEKDTTIDRKNVDKDYVKENLRWATMQEQSVNTRKQNVLYKGIDEFGNEHYFNCPSTFAKEHNLSKNNIYNTVKGIQKTHKKWRFEIVSSDKSQTTIP